MPLDELAIIDLFRPLAGEGAFGLRDDAGLIAVPDGEDLVVTTDMIVERVHFLPGDPADTVAKKALRVNLSDLAAKGARPLAYTLSLGVPAGLDEAWLKAFAAGLAEDQQRFGIALLGGDTIDVPAELVASVTAFGLVPKGRMVHRMGGRRGDLLFVTGTVGRSTLGLALLKGEAGPWDALSAPQRDALMENYRVPDPRVGLADALSAFASAAMDVSDGLVGDCDKLAAASGCAAEIEAERVPFALPAKDDAALVARLLTGGEDFEILAAVPPSRAKDFAAAAGVAGVPVTEIGRLVEGAAPTAVTLGGRPLPLASRAWVHGRRSEGA